MSHGSHNQTEKFFNRDSIPIANRENPGRGKANSKELRYLSPNRLSYESSPFFNLLIEFELGRLLLHGPGMFGSGHPFRSYLRHPLARNKQER